MAVSQRGVAGLLHALQAEGDAQGAALDAEFQRHLSWLQGALSTAKTHADLLRAEVVSTTVGESRSSVVIPTEGKETGPPTEPASDDASTAASSGQEKLSGVALSKGAGDEAQEPISASGEPAKEEMSGGNVVAAKAQADVKQHQRRGLRQRDLNAMDVETEPAAAKAAVKPAGARPPRPKRHESAELAASAAAAYEPSPENDEFDQHAPRGDRLSTASRRGSASSEQSNDTATAPAERSTRRGRGRTGSSARTSRSRTNSSVDAARQPSEAGGNASSESTAAVVTSVVSSQLEELQALNAPGLKVVDLRALLKKWGKPQAGRKAELISRVEAEAAARIERLQTLLADAEALEQSDGGAAANASSDETETDTEEAQRSVPQPLSNKKSSAETLVPPTPPPSAEDVGLEGVEAVQARVDPSEEEQGRASASAELPEAVAAPVDPTTDEMEVVPVAEEAEQRASGGSAATVAAVAQTGKSVLAGSGLTAVRQPAASRSQSSMSHLDALHFADEAMAAAVAGSYRCSKTPPTEAAASAPPTTSAAIEFEGLSPKEAAAASARVPAQGVRSSPAAVPAELSPKTAEESAQAGGVEVPRSSGEPMEVDIEAGLASDAAAAAAAAAALVREEGGSSVGISSLSPDGTKAAKSSSVGDAEQEEAATPAAAAAAQSENAVDIAEPLHQHLEDAVADDACADDHLMDVVEDPPSPETANEAEPISANADKSLDEASAAAAKRRRSSVGSKAAENAAQEAAPIGTVTSGQGIGQIVEQSAPKEEGKEPSSPSQQHAAKRQMTAASLVASAAAKRSTGSTESSASSGTASSSDATDGHACQQASTSAAAEAEIIPLVKGSSSSSSSQDAAVSVPEAVVRGGGSGGQPAAAARQAGSRFRRGSYISVPAKLPQATGSSGSSTKQSAPAAEAAAEAADESASHAIKQSTSGQKEPDVRDDAAAALAAARTSTLTLTPLSLPSGKESSLGFTLSASSAGHSGGAQSITRVVNASTASSQERLLSTAGQAGPKASDMDAGRLTGTATRDASRFQALVTPGSTGSSGASSFSAYLSAGSTRASSATPKTNESGNKDGVAGKRLPSELSTSHCPQGMESDQSKASKRPKLAEPTSIGAVKPAKAASPLSDAVALQESGVPTATSGFGSGGGIASSDLRVPEEVRSLKPSPQAAALAPRASPPTLTAEESKKPAERPVVDENVPETASAKVEKKGAEHAAEHVVRPSNLVTGLHSLTSLVNGSGSGRNATSSTAANGGGKAGAAAGAGGVGGNGPRMTQRIEVPALKKAEESRAAQERLQERRAAERAALLQRRQEAKQQQQQHQQEPNQLQQKQHPQQQQQPFAAVIAGATATTTSTSLSAHSKIAAALSEAKSAVSSSAKSAPAVSSSASLSAVNHSKPMTAPDSRGAGALRVPERSARAPRAQPFSANASASATASSSIALDAAASTGSTLTASNDFSNSSRLSTNSTMSVASTVSRPGAGFTGGGGNSSARSHSAAASRAAAATAKTAGPPTVARAAVSTVTPSRNGAVMTGGSSQELESKIQEKRAAIAERQRQRLEALAAEEERRRKELAEKEGRERARLATAKKAQQAAEAKAREAHEQRQAEAEKRRRDKEAKEAREALEKGKIAQAAASAAAAAAATASALQEAAGAAAAAASKPQKNRAPAAATQGDAAASGKAAAAAAASSNAKSVLTTTTSEPLAAAATGKSAEATLLAASAAAEKMPSGAAASAAAPRGLKQPTPLGTLSASNASGTAASGELEQAKAAASRAAAEAMRSPLKTAVAAPKSSAIVGISGADSYEMSDRDNSDTESESETEDGEGNGAGNNGGKSGGNEKAGRERKPKKHIPAWAQGQALTAALERQCGGATGCDPDVIFPQMLSCDLEAIFETKKKRYQKRGSSANWHRDRLTPHEIQQYNSSVGLDNTTSNDSGSSSRGGASSASK